MNAIVVYDSQYGNTERIAQAIVGALRAHGDAQAVRVDQAQRVNLQGIDLLIVGSPTQGWNATPAMQRFLDHAAALELFDVAVACFDTRLGMPRWMTGSAAKAMAAKLQTIGVALLVSPQSFIVKGGEGPLRDGELDRAATWARLLLDQVETAHPAAR